MEKAPTLHFWVRIVLRKKKDFTALYVANNNIVISCLTKSLGLVIFDSLRSLVRLSKSQVQADQNVLKVIQVGQLTSSLFTEGILCHAILPPPFLS